MCSLHERRAMVCLVSQKDARWQRGSLLAGLRSTAFSTTRTVTYAPHLPGVPSFWQHGDSSFITPIAGLERVTCSNANAAVLHAPQPSLCLGSEAISVETSPPSCAWLSRIPEPGEPSVSNTSTCTSLCARTSGRRLQRTRGPFYRTISGVRLCWELEEPKGFLLDRALCGGWSPGMSKGVRSKWRRMSKVAISKGRRMSKGVRGRR